MVVLLEYFSQYPIWVLGVIFSLAAGLATGVGAMPIFFTRNISVKWQDIFMGFGAGVMLAATSFSLIIPGLEAAGNGVKAAVIIVLGILFGGFFLWFIDKVLPHEHFIKGHEGIDLFRLKRLWLFIIAITLHNFPEGMAVGVGFGGGDIANGITLAIGIALQNIPEGLVVALALFAHKYSLKKSFLVALATGLVEPIGGLFGAGIVSVFTVLLPWGLAFAAGAMLFVISDEIIPESHRREFAKQATFGLMMGFVIMLFLDVTLG
jgi:ZIP family zinc transporter